MDSVQDQYYDDIRKDLENLLSIDRSDIDKSRRTIKEISDKHEERLNKTRDIVNEERLKSIKNKPELGDWKRLNFDDVRPILKEMAMTKFRNDPYDIVYNFKNNYFVHSLPNGEKIYDTEGYDEFKKIFKHPLDIQRDTNSRIYECLKSIFEDNQTMVDPHYKQELERELRKIKLSDKKDNKTILDPQSKATDRERVVDSTNFPKSKDIPIENRPLKNQQPKIKKPKQEWDLGRVIRNQEKIEQLKI